MSNGVSTWYNWRVIITATQQPAFILRLDTQGAPTIGPNGEAIDTSQSRVVDYRKDNSISIQEMHTITGQRYQIRHLKVIAAAGPGVTTTYDASLPFDINLICVKNFITTDMGGDTVSWVIAPETIVGTLAQNSSISDTVFHVSSTVITNADISWRVRIIDSSNPANYEDVGTINSIDSANSTLTLSAGATQAHTSGDYIALTGIYCNALELPPKEFILEMGLEIPRVAYVLANRVIRCEYTNNTNAQKTLYCYYSYYYGVPTL